MLWQQPKQTPDLWQGKVTYHWQMLEGLENRFGVLSPFREGLQRIALLFLCGTLPFLWYLGDRKQNIALSFVVAAIFANVTRRAVILVVTSYLTEDETVNLFLKEHADKIKGDLQFLRSEWQRWHHYGCTSYCYFYNNTELLQYFSKQIQCNY